MAKYRKKPVVVEAEIYKEGTEDGFKLAPIAPNIRGMTYKPYISTLEGDMIIDEGDYIITGVEGERYPCKPSIFHKTYEPLKDSILTENKTELAINGIIKLIQSETYESWENIIDDLEHLKKLL
ncbi:hypothetical protein [Niallia circulans]|uniref:hypothetical protein n=1 Tax=Niallia circulans TaxID=1397 RepID=UPI0034C62601